MRKLAAALAAALMAAALFHFWSGTRGDLPDPDVRIEALRATVTFLASLDPPRNHENIESMDRAARYIREAFARYGLAPAEQEFYVGGKRYVNVVAAVGPAGNGRIVVGAHYDVCGDQPGADDNASGVAALLEAARFAKRHEKRLRRTVEFVAFALEEPPYFGTRAMGSYVHAESLKKRREKVRGMICLETIGYFTDARNSQEYPLEVLRHFYPDRGDFIAVVGNVGSYFLVSRVARSLRAAAIRVETLKAPASVPGVDASDHRNYWAFGFDAVMITDTAYYRNRNYHTTGDTVETLSFEKLREVVKGVCWAIVDL